MNIGILCFIGMEILKKLFSESKTQIIALWKKIF